MAVGIGLEAGDDTTRTADVTGTASDGVFLEFVRPPPLETAIAPSVCVPTDVAPGMTNCVANPPERPTVACELLAIPSRVRTTRVRAGNPSPTTSMTPPGGAVDGDRLRFGPPLLDAGPRTKMGASKPSSMRTVATQSRGVTRRVGGPAGSARRIHLCPSQKVNAVQLGYLTLALA